MATFSKRHYVWLASFFRDEIQKAKKTHKSWYEHYDLDVTIENMANCLFQDNKEFDKQRFLDAIYDPQNIKDKDKEWDVSKIEMTGDALSKYDYEL